jgi:hypothetical protein
MKKFLFLLPITIISLPAQAITWKEFWEPFERPSYVTPYVPVPMCSRPIIREEYVGGNYWRPGYVRRWTEWVRVPCNYVDVY